MQAQLGPDDDDGAARVVDALAEQVLPEAALLALEHVGERAERALVRAGEDLAAAAVVEQGVDRLLEHPPLVADDDLGRVQVLEPLEPVVPVDDAAVEVVEVRGREPAAVERHERTEVGREHRDDLEHHVLGLVAGVAERLDDLEALRVPAALGRGRGLLHLGAELVGQRDDVELGEQVADDLAAHADLERCRTRRSGSSPGSLPRRGSRPRLSVVSPGSVTM